MVNRTVKTPPALLASSETMERLKIMEQRFRANVGWADRRTLPPGRHADFVKILILDELKSFDRIRFKQPGCAKPFKHEFSTLRPQPVDNY